MRRLLLAVVLACLMGSGYGQTNLSEHRVDADAT